MLSVLACSKDAGRNVESASARGAPESQPSSSRRVASGQHIGTRHDPLPAGIVSQGGTLVRIDGADYAFTRVRTPAGDMIWLDSIAPGIGQTPVKIVRAELRIPPMARDERLLMASCDVRGRLDGRIVAIVVGETSATKFANVRQAWRADARVGRFEVIPVEGITCEDPGTS